MPDIYRYAELSQLAYQPRAEIYASHLLSEASDCAVIEQGATAAVAILGKFGAKIIFRGSDLETQDWINNARFMCRVPFIGGGKVHRGFLGELLTILDPLIEMLRSWRAAYDTPLRISYAGHSKGAALATLAAKYFRHHGFPIGLLVTFGAPRVGNARFVRACDEIHLFAHTYRFENAADPVPSTPPILAGYRHHCPPWYFNAAGELHEPTNAPCGFRVWDSLGKRLHGVMTANPATIRSHLMGEYLRLLREETQCEKWLRPRSR